MKLQALVRGHLVRKQTADMIRCLHSLMAIQLRARVQRAQMADETELSMKKLTIYKDSAPRNQLISRTSDTVSFFFFFFFLQPSLLQHDKDSKH